MNINYLLITTLFFTANVTFAADEISLYSAFYDDNSGLNVVTPSFKITKEIGENNTINLRYIREPYDKAKPNATVDVISSASSVSGGAGGGFQEKRHEYALSGNHRFETISVGGAIYTSSEGTFDSNGYGLAYAQELAQKNFNLTLAYNGTQDKIYNPDNAPANIDFPQNKKTNTYTLSGTQLINPKFFVTAGFSYAQGEGYHSSPRRKILTKEPAAGGGTTSQTHDENHPETLNRNTLFLSAKHHLYDRSALGVNLSFYTDNWGVDSQALGLNFYNHLNNHMRLRLGFQMYQQSQADFYQAVYLAPTTNMSADTTLREFRSFLIGAKINYDLTRHGLKKWSTSFAIDWYKESNAGVAASILKLSLLIPY